MNWHQFTSKHSLFKGLMYTICYIFSVSCSRRNPVNLDDYLVTERLLNNQEI